jgi:hypothetical protein
MPAAGEAGAVAYLDVLASADEAIAGQLRAALKAIDDGSRAARGRGFARLDGPGRVAVLTALERAAPDTFHTAKNLVYEGYYTQAAVQDALGYRFIPAGREGAPVDGRRRRWTSCIGRARSRRAPPCGRGRVCVRSRWTKPAGSAGCCTPIARVRSTSSSAAWWSCAATRSARRACSSPRSRSVSPRGWRTRTAWWAATTWCTRAARWKPCSTSGSTDTKASRRTCCSASSSTRRRPRVASCAGTRSWRTGRSAP